MSNMKDAIDEIVKLAILPQLRRNAFKGSGRNFHQLDSAGTYRILNIQASISNSGDTGKFTINLGIFFPEFARLSGIPPKSKIPAEADCTVRRRIGQIMPEQGDAWWQISPEINVAETSASVKAAVGEHALPWLLADWSVDRLRDDPNFVRPMFRGIVEFMCGDAEAAQRSLQQAYDELKPARGNIVAIATRMGFELKRAVRPSPGS